ncbi:NADH:flavin oxidoreductase [Kineococcus rhizosphaerae]|uniref:2,4-dienoyl-CoA reductase-like NADH-dependent reductase (Old Yellow Enzyme family) n=1 Tax=Kineococcus rhizosphaerae TaxID=559628 RepID=A0A2T0QUU8_9ACTN|nr:NADH:flavin oxidoreductase [Kineococcus rhizosphaerae]PRY08944.1 2,4-dienoyl-CoA reductase-like NADH-dependent reductase (Old Yellow Enzyme family) [Kineococcus rhizosphaerae]
MSNQNPTDVFFEKYDLNGLTLPNRLAVAPMTRVSANADGTVTERVANYYERWARGGFGLVITEGSFTDSEFSQTYLHQAGLARPEHARAWSTVVERLHDGGSLVFAQLQHGGGQSQGNAHRDGTVGPSAIAPRGEQLGMYRGSGPYRTPRELTHAELRDVRAGFVQSAKNAVDAGFDGVEVHGANGYLLDEFITDYLNERTDEYGGDVAGRIRFAVEVCQDVIDAVGSQITVGIRISQGKVSDNHHKWAGAEQEAAQIFVALRESGVDYVHTTEYRASAPLNSEGTKTLARVAKDHFGRTVIANGGMEVVADSRELLTTGAADVVAIGKAALADPSWPQTLRAGGDTNLPLPDGLLGPLADVKDLELELS